MFFVCACHVCACRALGQEELFCTLFVLPVGLMGELNCLGVNLDLESTKEDLVSSLLCSYSEDQLRDTRNRLFEEARSTGLAHPKDILVRWLRRAVGPSLKRKYTLDVAELIYVMKNNLLVLGVLLKNGKCSAVTFIWNRVKSDIYLMRALMTFATKILTPSRLLLPLPYHLHHIPVLPPRTLHCPPHHYKLYNLSLQHRPSHNPVVMLIVGTCHSCPQPVITMEPFPC